MSKPPIPPPDPELPELGLLLGDDASAILEAGLEEPVTEARPTQIRYVPGRSITATFSVAVEGEGPRRTVCAYAGRSLPGTVAIVGDGTEQIAVWSFPHDPELPGLAAAVEPDPLRRILAEVGADHPIRTIRTRSYRPRRRAVIEVITNRHRLFVKVVRPSRIEALQTSHTTVAGAVRVPRSLGYSARLGIAVLEAIPGDTLRRTIETGETSLPSASELGALLDRLPTIPTERPGLVERLATHRRFLATVLPRMEERLTEMSEVIAAAPDEPLVAAHNDFHSAQVIVGQGRVSGLIDIDTVGMGRRADDYAMLLAHLYTHALASSVPAAYAGYGARLLSQFERQIDPASLRPRLAAATIAFATAPFRTQQVDWPSAVSRRLAGAEEWLGLTGS